MGRTVLIAGTHPMLEDVVKQYAEQGWSSDVKDDLTEVSVCPDEIFVATQCSESERFTEDSRNINAVRRICKNLEGRAIRCHLLLHSSDTMALFQTQDPCKDIREKIDILPFTMEILWARKIFTCIPGEELSFLPMDREIITSRSEKHVHIVMSGMNSMTEALARYAALTCHYPNYCRDHSLRTRITIVDENMKSLKDGFINRHQALFDNSFYRLIDLDIKDRCAVIMSHTPKYAGLREDFVDIEWEFVHGGMNDSILRDKLASWASSDKQQLTVFLNHESDDRNINDFMQLPRELHDNDVSIIIRTFNAGAGIMYAGRNNVSTFGTNGRLYDIAAPLTGLAKLVNHVYQCCYDDNFGVNVHQDSVYSPTAIDVAEAEKAWQGLSSDKRWASIHNAMTIPVKMRSIGHNAADWETFYSLSAREVELLAETEHNRWSVETLMKGLVPVTEEQEKEIVKDISLKGIYKKKLIHYDLRAYKDLRRDQTGKEASIYDICLSASIPLIASTFIREKAHE